MSKTLLVNRIFLKPVIANITHPKHKTTTSPQIPFLHLNERHGRTNAKVIFYKVEGLTNIITVAGPGVNMITWKYFVNPWYAPVYAQYNSTSGEW